MKNNSLQMTKLGIIIPLILAVLTFVFSLVGGGWIFMVLSVACLIMAGSSYMYLKNLKDSSGTHGAG